MVRIVSLIASATEIVCALGFRDQLVGRSHECDFPPSVKSLPACTAPRFPIDGSSGEIDRQVRALLQDSLSVYCVHTELLKELRPDVIVTQSQCEVCAVSERDVIQAVGPWLDSRPRIVSLKPDSLEDVWSDIRRVAAALDSTDRAEELLATLRSRMQSIESKARGLGTKPEVACVEWIEPLMASGNWMPTLVEKAGGLNVFGSAGKHAPALAWEELVAANPDILLVLPCGFDLERTRQDMSFLTRREGWDDLRAVRTGQVFLTDGNQYFNRPGPRLVESLEILAELFHPEVFHFGHEGSGWKRY